MSAVRSGDWAAAAAAYRSAVEQRPDAPPLWYFRLGTAEEHLGHWGAAGSCYERAMAAEPEGTDPQLVEIMHRMLDTEIREFPGRRMLLLFVARRLEEIYAVAAEPLPPASDSPPVDDPIYFYWAQGFDSLPEVVALCRRKLLDHAGDRALELDDHAVDRLITLPVDIEARNIAATHRSDLIRLQLLCRYGGSWLDGTCLVLNDPLPELARLRAPSGWFSFTKRRTTLATWLMSSVPGHRIARLLYAALVVYWRHHDRIGHYFALHYMFEALTFLDAEFGTLWQETPRLLFRAPFALRWSQADPYDPQRYKEILADSFVHKLTWKYPPEQAAPTTMLGRLLRTL